MKVAAGILTIVLVAAPSATRADSTDDPFSPLSKPEAIAKEKEAGRLWELREYDKAIEAYKAGYVIEPSARFLYNLGLVANQAGRHVEAIEYLERLQAKAQLKEPIASEVSRLIADSRAKLAKVEPATGGPAASTNHSSPIATRRQVTPTRRSWYRDPVGWSLSGGGLIAVGAGIGFLLNARGLRDDAGEPTLSQTERSELRDRADTHQLIGLIAGGAGLALLAAGVVKLAVAPGAEVVEGGAVVAIRGTW